MDDRSLGDLVQRVEELSRRLERVEQRLEGLPGPADVQKTHPSPHARTLDQLSRDRFKAWKEAQRQLTPPWFADPEPASPEVAPHAGPIDATPTTGVPAAQFGPSLRAYADSSASASASEPAPAKLDAAFAPVQRASGQASAWLEKNMRSHTEGGLQAMERMIGGRWYAIAGAVIVVIGVGLFFKLAVQNGWLVLPPAARCIGGAVFGLALLVGGEVARRRINAAASVGLTSAGLGVMYASTFAAYEVFKLLGPGVAFPLLVLVVVLGIGIAAHANLALVAAVSLIGGYITPLLFLDVTPTPGVLPSYLLALMAIGLVLSAWRGGHFVWVRMLAWWGTIIFGGIWAAQRGSSEPVIATLFLGAVWAGYHLALTMEAKRFGFKGASAPVPTRSLIKNFREGSLDVRDFHAWKPLASSFTTTSWAGLLGVSLVRQWGAIPDWLVPGALTVAAIGLSFALAGNLRVLRDEPEDDRQRLGACLAAQAGALLIATVALALSGSAQAMAWLGMGVGVVVAGRWIRSRGLDVYGLIVLSLAALRAVFYERFGPLAAAPTDVFGLALSEWTALMAGVGAGWLAAAWLLRRSAQEGSRWRAIAHTAYAVGITLALGSLLDHRMRAEAGAVVVIVMALALGCAGRGLSSIGLWAYALCVLAFGSLFPAVRNWSEAWTGGVSFLGIRLTLWSAAAAFGGAAWLIAGGIASRSESRAVNRFGLGAFCAGATLVMTALLHDGMRAEAGAVVGVVLALVMAGIAMFTGRRGVWGYAGLVFLVVTLFMPTRGWWQASVSGPGYEILGLRLTLWTGVLAFAGASWLGIARLVRRAPTDHSHALSVASAGIGLFLILVSLLHEQAAPESVCLAWTSIVLAAGVAGRFERSLALDRLALGAVVMPVLAWGYAYQPLDGWHSVAAAPGTYAGFWVGLAVAGVSLVLTRLVRANALGDDTHGAIVTTGRVITVLMLFATTSLEVGRSSERVFSDRTVQLAAVSVWWGVFATALIALGFWLRGEAGGARGIKLIRYAGLVLLGAASLKALVVDLNDVPPLGRAVSFIGLGLLMLGVAVTYARVAKRLEGAEPAIPDIPSPDRPVG